MLCGHFSHFGYSAMLLNLEHDLLSLILYLPAIGGRFRDGQEVVYHTTCQTIKMGRI
jgi:hypothetical protein